MAKPKRPVVIEKSEAAWVLRVYCDRHADQAAEVAAVEGISSVSIWHDRLWAWVDPRYDMDEVAAEVKSLLTPVEIPEAFLHGS